MRRAIWLTLALMGVAPLGMGVALAQQPPAGGQEGEQVPRRPGARGTPGQTQQEAIIQLQTEVIRLRQQIARLDARLAAMEGVGGAGMDPLDDPTAAGVARRGVIGTLPVDPSPGEMAVDAIFTGEVRSVSNRQLVLLGPEGTSTALPLGEDVRVFRGRQQVSLRQLEEGMQVRAVSRLDEPGFDIAEIHILALPEQPDAPPPP
jgi:hypothetical protein